MCRSAMQISRCNEALCHAWRGPDNAIKGKTVNNSLFTSVRNLSQKSGVFANMTAICICCTQAN